MPDILHLIKIRVSPERVYQGLTSTEGIRNWWTRDADLDAQIGGTGEFRFFYEGPRVTKVTVDEFAPPVRVGLHGLKEGTTGSALTFSAEGISLIA